MAKVLDCGFKVSKFECQSHNYIQFWHILLYRCNTDTSGNIIKHNLRISMNEQTQFFIKIYLSHFILKRVDVSVACERWVVRHILRERTSSSYMFFQDARGCQRLHPLASSSETPQFGCVSFRSTLILCTLSKSDHVVLITWSPSRYTPIAPDCPDCDVIFLFTNQNVTACQSTWGH